MLMKKWIILKYFCKSNIFLFQVFVTFSLMLLDVNARQESQHTPLDSSLRMIEHLHQNDSH